MLKVGSKYSIVMSLANRDILDFSILNPQAVLALSPCILSLLQALLPWRFPSVVMFASVTVSFVCVPFTLVSAVPTGGFFVYFAVSTLSLSSVPSTGTPILDPGVPLSNSPFLLCDCFRIILCALFGLQIDVLTLLQLFLFLFKCFIILY